MSRLRYSAKNDFRVRTKSFNSVTARKQVLLPYLILQRTTKIWIQIFRKHYYPDSDTEHLVLRNENVIGLADKENSISSL